MAVNRLEPDILTLHSSGGTKTLQIKVKGESLSVSVTDEIGLSTSTEIEEITPEQAGTIGYAFVHWSNCGKLNFQDCKVEPPLHRMKEPVRAFLIKGSLPELKGLEVAFDSEGYCALSCAANPRTCGLD